MPIQHAVLALLRGGPSHGYELKSAFEAAVGPQWGALNIGHLYQVLDRLSRDGQVTSSRVAQDVKPDRVVYTITDAGTAELHEWMAAPTPRTSGYRDDFFLKMMAAARSGDRDLVASVLTTQRGHLLRELRNLETLRRDPDRDPVVRLLLAAAARHVSADLAFLDDAEAALVTGDQLTAIRTTPRATRSEATTTETRAA
ncbi:PadR family transcriptional regulator [Hamadaea sp. NPDC050747]|uniref:PadR family transcriptional regulator n=1 Tax=Hamadaea sp. NPDC050747 TaxID=3155789 RepID=UPI0033D99557